MEIPDLPSLEVEHLYWKFSEMATRLRDGFEKWALRSLTLSVLSTFLQLFIPILAKAKDVQDLVHLLWIVYLMVTIAGVAAIKASLISIQEAKVHEFLDGLEKHSEGVENTIRQKLLDNDKIWAYFWRRPSFILGFRILACTFPFFGIWVWYLLFCSFHYWSCPMVSA